MGSSGSRAGSLRRSSQSWRTGLGGAGCCADAVSGKAAAALPRKAMNSRLLIVASLTRCGDLISFASIPRRRSASIASCIVRKARDAPLAPVVKVTPVVDVRKGRTMMNRRQFLCASAASFACVGIVSAATYDLVIKGGRVIDPSVGLDAVRDIAIVAGKIAAVEADIRGDATDTIDARGKIVAPGLIDIHTHAARDKEGPRLCLQDGVTGWVDCGSAGADNIDQVAAVARAAPQIGRVLVNISRTGNAPGGELMDINRANVGLALGAITRHRDIVIGVKARLTHAIAGTNDLEA